MDIFYWMPNDKRGHFVGGTILYSAGSVVNPITGLLMAVCAGLLKEAYDKYSGKGTPDTVDFIATAAGGLIPFLGVVLHDVLAVS